MFVSIVYCRLPMRLQMISAKKAIADRRSPPPHNIRGKQKCSILSGPTGASGQSCRKPTSVPKRPVQSVKLLLNLDKYNSHIDLLEPEHVIVELLLQGPFLIQHVGTIGEFRSSNFFLTSIPSVFISCAIFVFAFQPSTS